MTALARSVLDAFPKRLVRVLLSPVGSPRRNVLLMVVCLGLAGFFLWYEAPGLVRDWKISEAPVAVPDADMTDGRCRTHFVLVDCSATVSYTVAGVSYRSEPSLTFLSFGGYPRASVVRSASNPDLATLDIALDQLWNRIITLTCFVAGFAGGAIYFLTLIPEARRSTRLVQQKVAVSVVPMVVEITSSMSSYGMTTYYFSYDDGGRTRKTQNVMRKDEPFVVGKKGAHALALALLAAHGGRPILLNKRLTAIDLTDAERNALWTARDALG
jgi:hypothetical protein